jgi:hypothetical protein
MAEKEKAVTKDVRFNYFVGYITVDKEVYKKNERRFEALGKIHEKISRKKSLTPGQKKYWRMKRK